MPVIDYAALPEFPMRAGITGKWIAGHEHGSTSVSVLHNTVEPGVAVPRHLHEYEEVVLVEAGQVWVDLDKVVGLIADLDLRRRDLAVAAASRPCASCRRRMWRIDQ